VAIDDRAARILAQHNRERGYRGLQPYRGRMTQRLLQSLNDTARWCQANGVQDLEGWVWWRWQALPEDAPALSPFTMQSEALLESWFEEGSGAWADQQWGQALAAAAPSMRVQRLMNAIAHGYEGHTLRRMYRQGLRTPLEGCTADTLGATVAGGFHPLSPFCRDCPRAAACRQQTAHAFTRAFGFDIIPVRADAKAVHHIPRVHQPEVIEALERLEDLERHPSYSEPFGVTQRGRL
jgi:hypothetical protein